uniref:Uncharacterized protein n=1 Tax=Anguilla anguilla TaxID=7936 RepID=A0A0E9QZ81_ANGAN
MLSQDRAQRSCGCNTNIPPEVTGFSFLLRYIYLLH